ncbi:MAG: chlorite dismutase family protein [Candidatus Marsarchaeota archaeon]|nr:chlorite dismutase family protein [Candidatus Marsarchaeota archaeon]
MAEDYISSVLSFSFNEKWWGFSEVDKKMRLDAMKRDLNSWKKRTGALKSEIYDSLRWDSDIIIWNMCKNPTDLLAIKQKIEKTFSGYAQITYGMLSVYSNNRKKPEKGVKTYFVAYPMSKEPEWYLLPKEESKRIVAEHVEIAISSKSNDGIESYTTKGFGIADSEFVVIYEIPDLYSWVRVTEELRGARARKWITNETPILTGILHG